MKSKAPLCGAKWK